MKKYIALAVSLMMTLGCAQTAFAEVIRWNLSDGDLEIKESNVNPDGYEVTSTETTSNVIIVSNGVKTYIVLNNVDISSTESGIKIGDDAEVDLELKGENSIYNKGDYAGINVANGKLIIDGKGSIDIETYGDGAGIGSDDDENFTGVIIINGGTVTAKPGDDGAGIGAGDDGVMSGSITINGGTVTAVSDEDGAGIGAGDYGNITETGKIHIGGDSVVDIYSAYGLGIGSGDYGNMNGTIIITDNADVKIEMDSFYNPTAIGSGSYYDNELEEDDEEPYSMNGSIQILENAN
ncbi:MAG: hypothetical protein PUD43_07095, partial [Clostridia bacterium]|nr:hypothetical protein [Clostridia bacterium]